MISGVTGRKAANGLWTQSRAPTTSIRPVTDLKRAIAELAKGGSLTLSSVADGFDAFCAADLDARARRRAPKAGPSFSSMSRATASAPAPSREALAFAAPDIELLDFPSWDCQPYDRVSPERGHFGAADSGPLAPRPIAHLLGAAAHSVHHGQCAAPAGGAACSHRARHIFRGARAIWSIWTRSSRWLETNGFARASTVRDTGEYAVRGGILDLFAPGMAQPVRLDFFGDTLESIRAFDPETQRTTGQLRALDLVPMSEVQLKTETIRRFRQAYVTHFGAQTRGDALYEAVSEGRRHQGLEHWLPLFYEKLDTLFDYCAGAPLIFDPLAEEAADERLAQIEDYYERPQERA